MLDRSAVGQLSSLSSIEQNGNDCQQAIHYVQCSLLPAGNRCRFVLLDKDESCPTADLSNVGRLNGPAYSTGELLNTPSPLVSSGVYHIDLSIGCLQ